VTLAAAFVTALCVVVVPVVAVMGAFNLVKGLLG
jgi:hypothetical protein